MPQTIRQALSIREPRAIPDRESTYKHAGVLVPLLVEDGLVKVLFTKRTHVVEHHKGQISFPGGSVDEEDCSIEETALRETREEVGVHKKDVDILGRTDDILAVVSSFIMHPFVGRIQYPYDFIINTVEVQRLIKVPLDVFHPDNVEARRQSAELEGITYSAPVYKFEEDLIWGATARVMENFMDIIARKLPLLRPEK
ncbi:MAG: CoA pyrophosphatase [Desulfobacterales bacterium]|nr:CoA pyrophosphatase [Desulfobacterales bacterium]